MLWKMSGWYRVAFVADDGKHMVTGYDGWNLVAKADLDQTMLQFWGEGSLVRSVALGELISDVTKLEPTVSHWHWGTYVGFRSDGLFEVETVDGKRHHYDVVTGERVQ